MAASDKIFFLLDLEEEGGREKNIVSKADTVKCERVSFSYDQERTILKEVSFEIKKGQLVSLVGESGCGKSTIASLLTGREKGYQGSIQLGGKEISSLTEEALLSNVTLVKHNSYLFKGSVEENLRMGKEKATKEEMDHALKKVKLYDTIYEKGGLDFMLLEKASNLSGGQAQRLALARALLHDSPIYIFDEVTSNIDMESEKYIMSVIYELAKSKMVFLISHRLLNVVESNNIYVIEDGEIRQKGRHEELLKEDGIYKKLFEKQREQEYYGGGSDKVTEFIRKREGGIRYA